MRLARAFLLLSVISAASAARAGVTVYPASPVAGQDFVAMLDVRTCGVATNRTTSVVGTTIYLDYSASNFCFSGEPPQAPMAFPVKGLSAGTYDIVDRANPGTASSTSAFNGQVTVKAGTIGARPSYSVAGLWWVPDQPGWALNIVEGSAGQLFLVWYAYAPALVTDTQSGSIWYYVPGGQWTGGNTFTGAIAASTGPSLSKPFDPAVVSSTAGGLATVTVVSQDTIRFTVEPKSGAGYPANLQLTRYRF